MKKIYKTDLGTKIFVGLFTLFIVISAVYLLFFYKGPRPVFKVISIVIFTLTCVWWYIDLLFFEVIIEEDKITTKIPLLSILNKHWSIKWQDIKELKAGGGFALEEFGGIAIYPRDYGKRKFNKFLLIPIGFGVTQEILRDILPLLPKDTIIKIEPFLMKYIEGKPRFYILKRAIILILTAVGISLFMCLLVFRKRIFGI